MPASTRHCGWFRLRKPELQNQSGRPNKWYGVSRNMINETMKNHKSSAPSVPPASQPCTQPQQLPAKPAAVNPPDTFYVSFSADITASTTESLISVMANLVNQKAKTVHLLLSTPGGNVMNGMNLYNVLLGLPFELITHNVGNVDSIGN